MRTALFVFFVLTLGCRMDASSSSGANENQLAWDESAELSDRLAAARRLPPSGAARLRLDLIKRIPGQYGVAALNDVWILDLVGDQATARELEIKERDLNLPGKIRAAIGTAIDDIKERTKSAGQ